MNPVISTLRTGCLLACCTVLFSPFTTAQTDGKPPKGNSWSVRTGHSWSIRSGHSWSVREPGSLFNPKEVT
ncbi:MAG: hypothetical protein JNM68_09935, partial [Dinghuibacter sp.]|nr:hypothetical protein [Dinghuibacter sp.]